MKEIGKLNFHRIFLPNKLVPWMFIPQAATVVLCFIPSCLCFLSLNFFFQASYQWPNVLLCLIVFFGTNVLLILLCFWPICCVLVCCIFSPNCLIVFWILLWFLVPLFFCFYYDFSLESPLFFLGGGVLRLYF